jgi:hypothetical protein
MKLPLTGGCICGAVRYEITQAPILVYACHCTHCQRLTSSVCSIGVVTPEMAFRSTGKPARLAFGGTADSGRVKLRRICADCGAWLFGEPRPGTLYRYPDPVRVVRGGTLDDTSWLMPKVHFWTRSAQPWVSLPPDSVTYDTQPA